VTAVSANIEVPRERIAAFCRRHHVQRLSLFGSVLRSDFRPDSDVDVLVEFEPGRTVGFFTLFDMEDEFARLLRVPAVDLNTPLCLSEDFRDEVVAKAEVQYAQG
jgi:predicted nucleotidyltransferase